MADELKQTLYAASTRTEAIAIKPTYGGVNQAWDVDNTTAGTHDASDATYDHAKVDHNGEDQTGAAGHVRYNMDSCTYSGTISFLRFKWRAKKTEIADGGVDIGVWFKNAARGIALAMTTSFANYQEDHVVDPTNPWTQSSVNALTGANAPGCSVDMVGGDETDDLTAWISEFCIEVWGPEQITAGEAMGAETSMPAGTSVPGMLTTAGVAMGAEASMPAGVSVPGMLTTAGVAMGMQASIPWHVTYPSGTLGKRDPEAVTTLQMVKLMATVPVNLGDENASTTQNIRVPDPPDPNGGTLEIEATAFADFQPSPDFGIISGVRFWALAFVIDWTGSNMYAHDENSANPCFKWTNADGSGSAAFINQMTLQVTYDPVLYVINRTEVPEGAGLDASDVIATALVTTKPGGGAWTKEALDGLTGVKVCLDYLAAEEWGDLYVSEMWIEVHGVIGAYVPPIKVRQRIGQPARRADSITPDLNRTQNAGGFRLRQKISRTL